MTQIKLLLILQTKQKNKNFQDQKSKYNLKHASHFFNAHTTLTHSNVKKKWIIQHKYSIIKPSVIAQPTSVTDWRVSWKFFARLRLCAVCVASRSGEFCKSLVQVYFETRHKKRAPTVLRLEWRINTYEANFSRCKEK